MFRRSVQILLVVAAMMLPAGRITTPLAGQATGLSGHFGALTVPARDTGRHLALSLDRFTPNGKPSDPGNYNAVERTIAFNLLGYSVATTSDRWPNLTRRMTLQVGWGHDQPTEWMQNALHRLAGKEEVPSVDPRNHALDAVAIGEITLWSAPGDPVERFISAGFSAGTPLTESWLQVGMVAEAGRGGPGILVSAKVGAPVLGGVFADSTLASVYGSFEARVEAPLARWFRADWVPSPFLGIQHTTGIFADTSGEPIAERHGTYGLVDAKGRWRLEIWNEHFGGRISDKGPTGGGRIVVSLPKRR